MTSGRWWSQPFPPEGGQTASGIKNQLGRPKLSEYAVLVREAVQNSWDARRTNRQIDSTFTLKKLGPHAAEWKRLFGDSLIPGDQGELMKTLGPDSSILIVSDRRTVGLGGPLRSDEPIKEGEVANFVQFIRNVGEARDQHLGGGTYGFGKGIFFRVSRANTIIVDTQNTDGGSNSRRLMGAALGDTFEDETGRRFTGRHWWGSVTDDIPDPILGGEAVATAERLGLPGFDEGATGTDVVILLPDLGLEDGVKDIEELATRLRAHIYWNLWPKFGSAIRRKAINFRVTVEDSEVEFPLLESVPVLGSFSRALDNIHSLRGTDYKLKKYPKPLGEISTEYVVSAARQDMGAAVENILHHSPVESPIRHIARMRQAELVVDYFPAVPMPTPEVGYAGVFRSTEYSDDHFAAAEPPTHDDWETAGRTGATLGIVRESKKFIQDQAQDLVNAKTGAKSKTVQGLGRLANSLGSLVQGAVGTRATLGGGGSGGGGGNGGKSGEKKGFRLKNASKVTLVGDTPVVETTVEVVTGYPKELRLEASAYVVLAQGRKENPEDAPIGSEQSKFLGWYRNLAETPVSTDVTLTSEHLAPGLWTARFSHLSDAAVRVMIGGGM